MVSGMGETDPANLSRIGGEGPKSEGPSRPPDVEKALQFVESQLPGMKDKDIQQMLKDGTISSKDGTTKGHLELTPEGEDKFEDALAALEHAFTGEVRMTKKQFGELKGQLPKHVADLTREFLTRKPAGG